MCLERDCLIYQNLPRSITLISNLTHRRRAGTFFTMTIFIMMLISVALMYYYFQRTRVLQKEVAALRNGEAPADEGISSWLNWSGESQKPAASTSGNPETAPESQPTPVSTPPPPSTPSPTPTTISSGTLTLDQLQPAAPQATTPDTILSEQETPTPDVRKPSLAPDADDPSANSAEETPAPGKKIESIYDDPNAAPSVRVRTPQRR